MDTFIQQLINGLVLGSIYALIALGYTMVYGILGIVNFAHGDVLMLGALSALSAILMLQNFLPELFWLNLILALLFAMSVCMIVSIVIERIAYRPLRDAFRLAPLITAIGVSILLQTVAMIIWSRNSLAFPLLLPNISFIFFGASITFKEIIIIVISVILMLSLTYLIERTRLGLSMRAIAENAQVASLMGINVNSVIRATFILGAALAALAGVMMATNYGSVNFHMGFIPGLKAFTAAVLGGIGNIYGAMLGGILLGIIESLGAGYIGDISHGVFSSNYQDIFAFLVLITVLIFRPYGIMGERLASKV